MDPITLIAATSAAFQGVKQAVQVGKEVEEVFTQLASWARLAGELNDAISDNIEEKINKPSIWEKIAFPKNETQEAFDIYIARRRLIEHEKAIKHMFLYGELQDLGMDGYNELIAIREKVKKDRFELRVQQKAARIEYIENVKFGCILGGSIIFFTILITAIVMLWPK